ncbi:MAG: hypothetical protein WCD11_31310 [Solirubrobacteraceae bacterium]
MSSTSRRSQTPRTGTTAAGARAADRDTDARTRHSILARLDRIDVWSMPFVFVGIIGTGFLFAFYDVCCSRSPSPIGSSGSTGCRSRR